MRAPLIVTILAVLFALIMLWRGVSILAGQSYDGTAQDRSPRLSALKIIRENCQPCHSGDNPPNGLRLDSVDNMVRGGKSGPALVVFEPEKSLVYIFMTPRHGERPKMPPKGPLTEREQAAVRAWIVAGAHQHSMSGQEP